MKTRPHCHAPQMSIKKNNDGLLEFSTKPADTKEM